MVEYSNYSNVFSVENKLEFPEHIQINDYMIELEKSKQLFFEFIYTLRQVKLKTLKTYIKINLTNSLIQFFKSLTKASIIFDWKSDKIFHLCINYQGLNNITIKN